jgi:DUF4097 and DUF4098 domain-containing protein YvlB
MRRGSLVGPLLLIAAGVVFLAGTLYPGLYWFEMGARYWPLVLIGWGLLRLIEILVWAARSRPIPARGIGGGEWTVIVLICLVGSGMFFVNRHRPWEHMGVLAAKRIEMFGHAYDYSIAEQRQTTVKAPRVVIENLRGNARVVGADALEIKVSGHKTIRAMQQSDAEQADRQSPVEVSVQGDQVVVRTNQDRITGERRISTDLEITVPRGATIEGRGREGDFEIQDISGNVDVSSDNAGVRIQNVGGNARVDVRRSDVVRAVNLTGALEIVGQRGRDIELDNVQGLVTISGSFSGDLVFQNLAKALRFQDSNTELRVEKLPGRIDMDLSTLSGNKLVGPVVFTSHSRDVQFEDFSQAVQVSLDRGDVTLRPAQVPLPRIDVNTHSGNLDLALPEKSQFALKASTGSGEISNDFGPELKTLSPGNRGGALEGGGGRGTPISISTDRGSITVRKDQGASLTAHRSHPSKERINIQTDGGSIRIDRN